MKRGSDWQPLDLTRIKTSTLQKRKSKVDVSHFASPLPPGSLFKGLLQSLPQTLAAADFKEIVSCIVAAAKGDKMVLWGMGAHPIKVGLNPIVIDLMERGVIRGLAMNGAGIVHDVEIAMAGKTSEEVEEGLGQGAFGVTKETAEFINGALKAGHKTGSGLGEHLCRGLPIGYPPDRPCRHRHRRRPYPSLYGWLHYRGNDLSRLSALRFPRRRFGGWGLYQRGISSNLARGLSQGPERGEEFRT